MKNSKTIISELVIAATALICVMATSSLAWSAAIPLTTVIGLPNNRTSNDPPANAIDKKINTFTWTTESYNADSPSHIAVAFNSTIINRLRLWKDKDGGGGQNIKNLTIQYTTDTGPLISRSWKTVNNLSNGFNGTELLKASAVNPDGSVIGDIHNSTTGDGWASLTFDSVKATGLRISFSNPQPNGSCRAGDQRGFCNHYRVGELEVHNMARPSLSQLHADCNSTDKSRSADCVAAMHRFCSNTGRSAGLSQEVGANVFGVACFNSTWYGDVSLNDLRKLHGGCDGLSKSQTPECMSAIHRWCVQAGKGGQGIAQEVGNGVFGVACFNAKSYQDVALNALKNKHGGCDNLGISQSSECMAAVHRWCFDNGKGTTGLTQEVGNGVFGVGCFDNEWYGDVRITPPSLSEIPPIIFPGSAGSTPHPAPTDTQPCQGKTPDGRLAEFIFDVYCGVQKTYTIPSQACTRSEALVEAFKLVQYGCFINETTDSIRPTPPCQDKLFQFCVTCYGNGTGPTYSTKSATACTADVQKQEAEAKQKVLDTFDAYRLSCSAKVWEGHCP